MAAKKTETETETQKTSTIEFVDTDKNEDFHDDDTDKDAIDGEILSEIKVKPGEAEEFYLDEFAQFLNNLPTDTEASFIVSRLPDRNLKGEFRLPCNTLKRIDVFYWNGETSPDEFYNQITEKHGGGKYNFQIREGKGFGKAWTQILADPPFLTEIEKAFKTEKEETKPSEQPRNVESSQVFANQPKPENKTDGMREMMNFFKEMKEFEKAIAPLQPEQIPQSNRDKITQESIQMRIVESSLGDPEILKMAVRSVFNIAPEEADEKPAGFWESVTQAFVSNPTLQNKLGDMISSVFSASSSLVGNLLTPTQPPIIPNAPFGLDSIRRPRNDAQPEPQPKNEPQTQETAQNAATQTAPAMQLQIIPSLKLED